MRKVLCLAVLCLAGALQAGQIGHAPAEVVEPDSEPRDQPDLSLPRAVIVPDGEVQLGCWMLFDASASTNPPGGKLEYEWRQVTGPVLAVPALLLKDPKLWLFLSQPGQFRFALRVRNEKGWSLPRETKFTVKPGRPFLTESEGSKLAGAGEKVELPGEGWRQVSGPPVILRYDEAVSYFRPARCGQYIFEAPRAGEVPERRGAFVPPGRDGILGDRRPQARLPKNLTGFANHFVLIDGSLSFDPDGAEETQTLAPRWSTPEKYRSVELERLPGLKARFKAPRSGDFSVLLVVSDGRLESEPPEKVFIHIEPERPGSGPLYPDTDVSDASLGFGSDDIRYKKVSLGLWGDLERAVQMFPSRCGAALRVDPQLALPETFSQIPLNLEVVDGALLHLVDWIARQTDTRYRRDGERSFWLTNQLAWAKTDKLEAAAVVADALHAKEDGSDLMALVTPCFQQILDARAGTALAFEPGRKEIQAVLPGSACVRLKEICAALREPEGQGLPPPELPGPAEWRLQRLLGSKTVSIQKTQSRLVDVLRELSQAGGVAVGFDPRQFPKGAPALTVNITGAPLRDAARTLVQLAGFDGCSVEPPGGLWFYRGARPYPSGQLLWDEAFVRAYDLSRLLPRIAPISGEAIAYAVQKRIYPDSWKEAGTAVFYHPPTKKLLVMHGPAGQRRVLEFLHDLAQRGEWALGPTE